MIKSMMLQLLSTTQTDLTQEQVSATVNAYLDSWRNGDSAARAALFADHAVLEDPVGTPPVEGKAALLAFWQRAEAYPSKFDAVLASIVVCGNEAIVKFALRIEIIGVASGTLQIVENFQLDKAGKIVRLRAFWDAASVS
ncbi:MAG: nuclear transport factor 2 family protein [Pseudomonadota bacterium]|nr:nuclear transport factor 2 family protein [Pseudomonadota bacterium]